MGHAEMNWLLLRGLGREIRHWNTFPETLSQIDPSARVHVLDLPGFGREAREQSPVTIAGNTDFLRRRWKILRDRFPGSWGIVGVSMGGMVAMDWTSRFSRDFERLVLINSSSRDVGRPWERMTFGAFRELSQILTKFSAVEREKRVLALTVNLIPNFEQTAHEFAEISKSRPQNRINFFRQLGAAISFRKPDTIDIPILILKSAKDKLVNPLCSDRLREHYKAELKTHLSAGHDLPLDDGEWVALRIREWNEGVHRITDDGSDGK
jgi:pimeloyl-[acyl-carrier protein] methyl ester esterase